MNAVFDAGCGGDERQVELSLESLFHDLHVQQTEEAAPEAEPQRSRTLGAVGDGGVVELQFLETLTEPLEVVAVDGEQPTEHHRLGVLVAGQRFGTAVGRRGDGFATASIAHIFDTGNEIAHLAGPEFAHRRGHGHTCPHLDGFVQSVGLNEPHLGIGCEATVHHPHRRHHTAVLVELAVEDERLQRRVEVAHRRRNAFADRLEQIVDTEAGLG